MNTLITYADLPPAEREVATLYVSGYTTKEIAAKRNRSIDTVHNQIRNLFRKTGVRKDTEFGVWYFCTRFKISFDMLPIQKVVVSCFLLFIISFQILFEAGDFLMRSRRSESRTGIEERENRNSFREREKWV